MPLERNKAVADDTASLLDSQAMHEMRYAIAVE